MKHPRKMPRRVEQRYLRTAPTTDHALLAQVQAELSTRQMHQRTIYQPTRLDRIFEICDRIVPDLRRAG